MTQQKAVKQTSLITKKKSLNTLFIHKTNRVHLSYLTLDLYQTSELKRAKNDKKLCVGKSVSI